MYGAVRCHLMITSFYLTVRRGKRSLSIGINTGGRSSGGSTGVSV